MVIMFVRHADDVNDVITERGRKRCELMIDYEEQFEFAKIYSSPAKRCVETAKELTKKFDVEIEIDNDLIEREKLIGRVPKNEKEQAWYDNYLNPKFSFKNPEGCKEFIDRTFRCFRKIVNNHFDKNENAIIVAHSGTTYALNAFVSGIRKGEDIKWMRVGNCAKLYFEINEKV